MPEINRRWIYPTITASENKGIERIALSGEGTAHEVVGVDGSRRFGCRPSSGFRLAHTLDIYKDFSGLSAPPPNQSKTSTVTDCYPVHFQIREGEFGHGFVYRVKVAGGTNSAIYMDFAPTNTVDAATGWRTVLISDHTGGSHVSSDDKMDVVSMGRYVFVFVKGRATRVFYVDFKDLTANDGDNPTYQHKVVDGGPGKRPLADGGSKTSLNFQSSDASNAAGRSNGYAEGDALQAELQEGSLGNSPLPANTDFHQFSPGDYTFAFYLNDSITGRRSAITEIVSKEEGGSEVTNDDYISWVFEIDPALYDQIYIFRSAKMQSVGGTYSGSILHLDTIYNVEDLQEMSTSSNTNYSNNDLKVYKARYQLSDIALVMQDVYLDKTECDDEMPFSGSAVAFENSLLVSDPLNGSSDIRTSLDSRERNIGELRWSSLTERSPELFPINNKYSPDVYQNRITRLCRAGDYAVGFSADRIYHIRRNGIYLKIEEIHSGYGLASEEGFAMAGPMVYFVTTKGIKAIANNGQLDDVKALDNLIMEDWYANISDLRLAFDPYASCLFVHNPFKEQTVCMWFSTGRVTELHDTCFDDLRTGIFPKTYTRNAFDDTTPTPALTTSMVERSFFLQNHPSTNVLNIDGDWKPRVYVLDVDRDKKQVNSTDISVGQNVLRTLDCKGDSVFTVASITDNATNKEINLKSGTTGPKKLGGGNAGTKTEDLVGAYAYVMSATDSTIVGKKFQIFSGTAGTVSTDGSGGGNGKIKVNEGQPNPVPPTLAAGDVISISPVLFRYVGGALPMIRTKDNQVVSSFDLFQNKQLSSVGCHFSDVSGGVAGYKYFRGLVYNATSDSASVSAFPLDFSGTIIGDSIKEGESDDYAAFTATGLTTRGRHGIQDSALNPGIEVFCPDLDYKLMALICRGRTTGTDTTERNSS